MTASSVQLSANGPFHSPCDGGRDCCFSKNKDLRLYLEHSNHDIEQPPAYISDLIAQDGAIFIKDERTRVVMHSCNRFLLRALSSFHRVDLMQGIKQRLQGERGALKAIDSRKPERRLLTVFSWPNLIFALYCYMIASLTTNLYHQYTLDHNKLKLRQLEDPRMREFLRATSLHGVDVDSLQHQIKLNINRTTSSLKSLGAPHYQWTIIVEIMYLYSCQIVALSLLLGPWWLRFHRLIHFPWARFLMDRPGECRYKSQLIITELDKFLASVALLDKNCRKWSPRQEQRHSTWWRLVAELRRMQLLLCLTSTGDTGEQNVGEQLLKCQLETIARQGRLNSTNRGLAWLDKLALINCAYVVTNVVHGYFWIVVQYILMETYYSRHQCQVQLESHQDWLMFFNSFMVLLCILLSAAFYGALNMITLLDQIKAAQNLAKSLKQIMQRNDSHFEQLAQAMGHLQVCAGGGPSPTTNAGTLNLVGQRYSRGGSRATPDKSHREAYTGAAAAQHQMAHEQDRELFIESPDFCTTATRHEWEIALELVHQIELDLLTAVLQFRLFEAEFQLVKRSFSSLAFGFIFTIVSLPIIIHCHLAYIASEVRPIALGSSVAGVIPTLFILTPLCVHHKRCLDIYTCLWSLAAQLTHFLKTKPQESSCVSLHRVLTLLQRELSHPEHCSDKFSVYVLYSHLTYANLLRLSFWISLGLFSLLRDFNPNSRGIISRIQQDPLGMLSF